MRATIIIPTYQPTDALTKLVHELLIRKTVKSIIVVNDGSNNSEAKAILSCLAPATVIHHPTNLGKGCALKTGFHYYLNHQDPASSGIITADADGQHAVEDILHLAEKLEKKPNALHLGTRKFTRAIPLRSKIGNLIINHLFQRIIGKSMSDTQTGLRGIPNELVTSLMVLDGKGYEFETEMLITAIKYHVPIYETPIQTIYNNNNSSSHFRPVFDSYRIYQALKKGAKPLRQLRKS